MDEFKKLSSLMLLTILALFIISCVSFIVCKNYPYIDSKLCGNDTECEQVVQEDTCTNEVLTVDEYLDFYENIKELRKSDSLYYTIPVSQMRAILENFGTDLTTTEIVNIYRSNRKLYDDIVRNKDKLVSDSI